MQCIAITLSPSAKRMGYAADNSPYLVLRVRGVELYLYFPTCFHALDNFVVFNKGTSLKLIFTSSHLTYR